MEAAPPSLLPASHLKGGVGAGRRASYQRRALNTRKLMGEWALRMCRSAWVLVYTCECERVCVRARVFFPPSLPCSASILVL